MSWLIGRKRRETDRPDFTGKVVAIHCASGKGGGIFEDVRIVRVGYSHFVVGRKVETEPWLEGRGPVITGWFGINEIGQMYVCDDRESARQACDSDVA